MAGNGTEASMVQVLPQCAGVVAVCLALAGPLARPALGWEAGVEGGLCTLGHEDASGDVRLTFDPAVPHYTITLTTPDPWPVAPSFAMVFDGPRPNIIRTDRHVLSPDRRALSVTDRGFGNVLDGLQFNGTATGISGPAAVTLSLEGAAPEVAAFRACTTAPTA